MESNHSISKHYSRSIHRARNLRRNAIGPELALWQLLRDRRLRSLNIRRQHPVGPYIADCYCHVARLVIEIDGQSHDGMAAYDLRRTSYLKSQGLTVLRVSNDGVLRDPESVLLAVARAAGVDLEMWLNATNTEPEFEPLGRSPSP